MDALQLTVPVPAHVARDLDIVVGLLRVDREKLLAEMLEREVTKEKERLLMELGTLYAQDKIAKVDLVEIVGETIASEQIEASWEPSTLQSETTLQGGQQ